MGEVKDYLFHQKTHNAVMLGFFIWDEDANGIGASHFLAVL